MSMNDPELSRLSNKAIYGNYLEVHRRRQQLVWIFFWESCGECESGGFVKNILADVTAVRVGVEYDGFTPDICLDRNNKPPVWIEFSPPTVEKVAYCAAHHIDLFELAGQHPSELSVKRAHISPRNCCARERKRLRDLWEGLKDLPDPLVGIREDFRSPGRKQREFDEFWAEAAAMRDDVAQGKIRCIRCDKTFQLEEDGGYGVQYTTTHRPNGECGPYPMCLSCEFSMVGAGGGDASEWWEWQLKEGCPTCQPFIDEANRALEVFKPARSVVMPAPYGSRVVQEPDRRAQEFVVGEHTVKREEMQSILAMVDYILLRFAPRGHRDIALMLKFVREIQAAVRFANGIMDWDWLEGIGESYVPASATVGYHKGDRLLPLKRWWRELPPFPLDAVSRPRD